MPLTAQLGNLTFRINPSQIAYEYHLDTSVTKTIGGRVVQVYGATLGDLTVQGLFGQERGGQNRISRELAAQFHAEIAQMVKEQSKAPTKAQLTGADDTVMHKPHRFVVSGNGAYEWDFQVYIKSLTDVNDNSVSVSHKVGKFSYGYNLVLFIVEDNTGTLKKVATDAFIDRLSQGVGWQKSSYNGSMTREDLAAYLAANSPDGTIHGLLLKTFTDVSQGTFPPAPGAAATAKDAQGKGVGTAAPGAPAAPGTLGGLRGNTIPGVNGGAPIVIPGLSR